MNPAGKLRLSPAMIGLDLLGTVLLALGALELTAAGPGFLPPLLGASPGWPLLIAGIGLMCLATFLMLAPLLQAGGGRGVTPTVERKTR